MHQPAKLTVTCWTSDGLRQPQPRPIATPLPKTKMRAGFPSDSPALPRLLTVMTALACSCSRGASCRVGPIPTVERQKGSDLPSRYRRRRSASEGSWGGGASIRVRGGRGPDRASRFCTQRTPPGTFGSSDRLPEVPAVTRSHNRGVAGDPCARRREPQGATKGACHVVAARGQRSARDAGCLPQRPHQSPCLLGSRHLLTAKRRPRYSDETRPPHSWSTSMARRYPSTALSSSLLPG